MYIKYTAYLLQFKNQILIKLISAYYYFNYGELHFETNRDGSLHKYFLLSIFKLLCQKPEHKQ